MSSVRNTSNAGDWGRGRGVVGTIRNSVLLMIALFGIVLFVLGFLINTGIWAAMFAVWGTALFLFGVTGYTVVWWQRR